MEKLITIGNHKVGKDTAIFNMTSATDCPSRRLGLCQAKPGTCKGSCYAMKAERQYKECLPFRRRQADYWDSLVSDLFFGTEDNLQRIYDLASLITKSKRIKYLRFSVAGDFRSDKDVIAMAALAQTLRPKGIIVYGYTARKDLNFASVPSNMVVNGSGFMIHNMFKICAANDKTKGRIYCPGNCRTCNLCKERKGKTIYIREH